jgi:hypothetical protein
MEIGMLYIDPVSIDGEKKTTLEKMAVGAVITAIGFKGVTQVESSDSPLYYGAMALTGEGALPASINNIKKIIDEKILPDLAKLPKPTLGEFQAVQAHVAEIRKMQGDEIATG